MDKAWVPSPLWFQSHEQNDVGQKENNAWPMSLNLCLAIHPIPLWSSRSKLRDSLEAALGMETCRQCHTQSSPEYLLEESSIIDKPK